MLSEYYDGAWPDHHELCRNAHQLFRRRPDGSVNAPVPVDEPALTAVDLAVEMQESVQELIAGWRARGYHRVRRGPCQGSGDGRPDRV